MMVGIAWIPNATANENEYRCDNKFNEKGFNWLHGWKIHTERVVGEEVRRSNCSQKSVA